MRKVSNAGRIAMILLLALPVGALAQPSLVVVPGLGVGRWTVDVKLADYVFKMGETLVADTRPSGTDLVFRPGFDEKSWASPRIFVVYPVASNTVWAVGTSEADARTADHVGVGSTEQQVTAAYQDPQATLDLPLRSHTLIYDTRGIAFEYPLVPATGQWSPTAGRVFVFRPGQAKEIWRLP